MTKTCSTAEAAKRLGVASRTIQLWVESGYLQAWKTVGGHRRILSSSLEEFLKNRSRPHSAIGNEKELSQNKVRPSRLVFVCDSDQNMRALFRKYSTGWDGIQWKFFKCPFEAIIGIGEKRPNIFISDICTPGLDIVHMARILKDHPNNFNMKLVLTSNLTEDTLARLNLPSDLTVLRKPFSSREIFNVIDSALGSL